MIPSHLTRHCPYCQEDTIHATDGRVGGRESCQAVICQDCGRASATFVQPHEMRQAPALRVVS